MEQNKIEDTAEFKALFVDLGREVLKEQMGFNSSNEDDLESEGRRFWRWNQQEIHSLVCSNEFLNKHLNSPEAELLAAVSDVLTGFPFSTLARIVIRIGLVRFCGLSSDKD